MGTRRRRGGTGPSGSRRVIHPWRRADPEQGLRAQRCRGRGGTTNPELAEVYQSREQLRVDGYRDFVNGLALPAGANPERAADILITMLSPQFYLALRTERGWPHEEIVDWMTTTIPGLMLGTT